MARITRRIMAAVDVSMVSGQSPRKLQRLLVVRPLFVNIVDGSSSY